MRVVVVIALFALGCSPSAGDPTLPAGANGKPITRRYAYECLLPTPGDTSAPHTFTGIYDEIISSTSGVAKCQNGACHGDGASNGGVALGSTPKSAFCGLAVAYEIDSLDCSVCDFCAEEVKSATAGACGTDSD